MTDHVLLYVQHLLGVGHMKRAAAITRGIRDAGMNVTVAVGGCPVPNADFADASIEYLPAIRAVDASFSTLVDENDEHVSESLWKKREHMLLDLDERLQPNAILTEHFPFGRRKFRRELLPLFKQARMRPEIKILGSVRDILITPSDSAKADKMVHLAQEWYNAVFVHSDPTVLRLEDSFSQVSQITDLLKYTGYVAESHTTNAAAPEDGDKEIIVSAGGGAVGETLFKTALAARRSGCQAHRTWRFLAGGNLSQRTVADLQNAAPDNVIIEAARPDFQLLLKRAALSVSQAGYNTVMDLMITQCPSIVVPFATGGETEQTLRARTFAEAGLLTHLPETELSVDTLATRINTTVLQPRQKHTMNCDTDGIRTTGRLIAEMCS